MIVVWYIASIIGALLLAAALLVASAARDRRKGREARDEAARQLNEIMKSANEYDIAVRKLEGAYYSYSRQAHDLGLARFFSASILAVLAVTLGLVIGSYAVARTVAENTCDKKDEVSNGRYEWVDYHYFGYECLLRTPSGNITPVPVMPIENVTED